MDDETLERLRRPAPYVREVRGGPGGPGPDQLAKLPGPGDPYQAAGLPENHDIPRLVLVMGRVGFRPGAIAYHTLQYARLQAGDFTFLDDGQTFRLVFDELQPRVVTASGRNLLRLYDYIGLRRLPWIRLADRGQWPADPAEPVITRLEVADWVRERR